MSEQERASRDVCARYAPTLAALDAPALDADERRAALAHLAGCAYCQADQRAYARLDDELRSAFGPAPASPLRTADLLAAIGATHEPVTQPRGATQPASGAIRSMIDLGDISDRGEETRRMSMGDERGAGAGGALADGREVSQGARPAPHGRGGQRRWTIGYSAVAAVIVFAVVAAALFASRRPLLSRFGLGSASPTPGISGQVGLQGLGRYVSMVSATDGWAVGQQTIPGGQQMVFYHYNGARWTASAHLPMTQGKYASSLKMVSATDGWFFDGASLYHYDGVAWRPAPITLPGNAYVTSLIAVGMVSPTEGWAAADVSGSPSGGGGFAFLRYDGHSWTVQQSTLMVTASTANEITITAFTLAPGGDAWAVGFASPGGRQQPGQLQPAVGLVFHCVNGDWQLASQLNRWTDSTQLLPNDIVMTSATSGWIAGEASQTISSTSDSGLHALLWRYDGASWTPVVAPIETPTSTMEDTLDQIAANGPNDIWMEGQSSQATQTSTGAQAWGLLLHYDGKSWSQVKPNAPVSSGYNANINSIALAPDGTLWAVGGANPQSDSTHSVPLFLEYAHGAWSIAPVVNSGK